MTDDRPSPPQTDPVLTQREIDLLDEAERARLWRWTFAILLGLGLLGFAIVGFTARPRHEPDHRMPCQRNLSDLGQLFSNWRLERPREFPHNGPALFLWFRKKREIREGEEEQLLCPGDPDAEWPSSNADREAYSAFDLGDPSTWENRISYAVRDFRRFPLSDDQTVPEVIASCRCGSDGKTPHHKDGLTVLFSDGHAKFKDWAVLGLVPAGSLYHELPPEGTVLVGPGSPNAELAKLIVPR